MTVDVLRVVAVLLLESEPERLGAVHLVLNVVGAGEEHGAGRRMRHQNDVVALVAGGPGPLQGRGHCCHGFRVTMVDGWGSFKLLFNRSICGMALAGQHTLDQ